MSDTIVRQCDECGEDYDFLPNSDDKKYCDECDFDTQGKIDDYRGEIFKQSNETQEDLERDQRVDRDE